MGYANTELGDYRQASTGKVVPDSLYNVLRRAPGFRPTDWVKVVIAAPVAPAPVPVVPRVPSAPYLVPTGTGPTQTPPPPLPVAPTVPTSAPSEGAATAQAAAPLVAAAATPVVGPIAAAIPPIVDQATQPPRTRIRVVPDASFTPTAAGSDTGSASIPAAEASVTATGASPLDMLKKLPPAALAGIAGLVLFLLSSSPRRR